MFLEAATASFVIAQFLILARPFGFSVIAYCVMPDHFHALVEGARDDASFKPFVNRWKQATGLWWKQHGHHERLWQEGYVDRILREDDPPDGVARYVIANPMRAGLVDDLHDYPHVGSGSYSLDELLQWSLDWRPSW